MTAPTVPGSSPTRTRPQSARPVSAPAQPPTHAATPAAHAPARPVAVPATAAVPGTGPARAIILGARRGERRLDAAASRPYALVDVNDRPVLDWIETALRAAGLTEITYVGGYQIQKVMERYPKLAFRYHPAWQEEGELAALRLGANGSLADRLVLRGDTIVLPDAVQRVLGSPAELVVGLRRVEGETVFAGLLAARGGAVAALQARADALLAEDRRATLDALVTDLSSAGIAHETVDLTGLAAPIADAAAVLRTVFRGKAGTLEGIARLCRTARVLDQVRFTVAEWHADPQAVIAAVRRTLGGGRVVVRSSTVTEDAPETSAAGRFESVLDVELADRPALSAAIEHVVASYADGGARQMQPDDEVLVQPFVPHLAASGVLFTRDLTTGAPYFVLSVDRASGRSDVVTSGSDGEVETYFMSWAAPRNGEAFSGQRRVVDLGRELINLTYSDALDVEFGLDRSGELYLFQVRPLAGCPADAAAESARPADEDLLSLVRDVGEFVAERLAPRPGIPGRTSALGNMPDWNPAEMIGPAPRPLALSLYQRLVGDRAWSRARARLGYRDVEPEPLILSLGGRPYVDVRASLASFLPASLDDATAAVWVDACVARLRESPFLHDKIEFEVTPTCLAFDWARFAGRMRDAGLDDDAVARFHEGLRALTAAMIDGGERAVRAHLAGIEALDRARAIALQRRSDGAPGLARAVRDHVERCERLGVEPFAILARFAFVALAFLRSLRDRGVLDDEEMSLVLRSVPTVATETAVALEACASGRLTRETFVARYGHLRSNSYEMTAPTYAESLDRLLASAGRGGSGAAGPDAAEAEAVFARHAPEIETLLGEAGLPGDASSLLAFIRASIAGRERSKFEFMKDLALALDAIRAFGERLKLAPDDLSYVTLPEVLGYATDSLTSAAPAWLRRSSGHNRKRADLTAALRLPDLITSAAQVAVFRQEAWQPNFVTTKHALAPARLLEPGCEPVGLDGAIVLIRSADPGWDWVFSHPIAGLITEFGGVGSHMAIRAAEFGLPAAIGCGALLFDKLAAAGRVELDCASGRVRPA